MELWVSVNGEKQKFQGSFRSVMEKIFENGKDKELKLLSIHAPKKELRRFKREMRANHKNLYEVAKNMTKWFLKSEYRRTKHCLKYFKNKTDKRSKEYYKNYLKRLEELENKCKIFENA